MKDFALQCVCTGALALRDVLVQFGGSYGGMLAAWFRQKYPHVIDGAVAASAPVLAFDGLMPVYETQQYWSVVSSDFSVGGGCDATCSRNILVRAPQRITCVHTAGWFLLNF